MFVDAESALTLLRYVGVNADGLAERERDPEEGSSWTPNRTTGKTEWLEVTFAGRMSS